MVRRELLENLRQRFLFVAGRAAASSTASSAAIRASAASRRVARTWRSPDARLELHRARDLDRRPPGHLAAEIVRRRPPSAPESARRPRSRGRNSHGQRRQARKFLG